MANAGDRDEYGRTYFPGLGWSGQAGGGNQSFAEQGFAGVGGQPAPVQPPRDMDTGSTYGSGLNPTGRPGFPQTPNLAQPNPTARPGYTPTAGQPNLANPAARYPNLGGGEPPAVTAPYSLNQGNPASRGGAPSGGGQESNLGVPKTGGGAPGQSADRSNLANIYYNQQQAAARAKGTTGEPIPSLANGAIRTNGPLPGGASIGGNNQPDAEGRLPFGTVGSPQARSNSNDLVGAGSTPTGGFTNTHEGAYVNHPRVDPNTGYIDGGWVQTGSSPEAAANDPSIIDPSQIKYDPEFGWITMAQNYKDMGQDGLSRWMPAIVGAAMGGFVGVHAGVFGAGAESGGAPPVDVPGPVTPLPPNPPYTPIAPDPITGLPPAGAPSGGGPPIDTTPIEPLPPNQPYTPVTPDPTIIPPGGTPGTLRSLANNPLVRLGAGALANTFTNQGGPSSGSPTGRGGEGGFNIGDIVQGGINLYNDNRNLQQFETRQNELINRGDYNSEYRPGYLSSLSESYKDPDKFLAPYKAGDERDQENLRRNLDAKGFNMSGNELGELTSLQSELRQKHLMDIRGDLRNSASLGHPEQMAVAGLRNLPFMYQATANRNAAANGIFGQAAQRLFGQAAGQIGKAIQDMISKGMSDEEIKAEIERQTGGTNTYDEDDWQNVMRDIRGSNGGGNSPGGGGGDDPDPTPDPTDPGDPNYDPLGYFLGD